MPDRSGGSQPLLPLSAKEKDGKFREVREDNKLSNGNSVDAADWVWHIWSKIFLSALEQPINTVIFHYTWSIYTALFCDIKWHHLFLFGGGRNVFPLNLTRWSRYAIVNLHSSKQMSTHCNSLKMLMFQFVFLQDMILWFTPFHLFIHCPLSITKCNYPCIFLSNQRPRMQVNGKHEDGKHMHSESAVNGA